MPPALELRALKKSFGRPAVDGLDLCVAPGEIYALLGPNGAGKTTTLRMIAGLLPADAGEIRVFGVDSRRHPVEAKRLVAWLPDEPQLYDKLDPEHRRQRCEGFSKGMRQKVALAGALIHDPKLLMLDEPLTGLDAGSARQVKDMLAERVKGGAAMMLTTHILEVAERMADRIGILARGRLVAEGSLAELRGTRESATLEDLFLELTRAA
jgi:ABC-2 type transport system ATP-binding protein